jgi:F-type H+-transporting ATPase subunit delta
MERAGIGTEVRNLVGVMITNRRLSALPAVAQAFGALLAARRGQQTAEVTTAHALSDTQRAQITARLIEAGYKDVRLIETVDPTILGGLIVKIGSRLYDSSVKSKLLRLQYAMKGAA